jgi:2'-hydroxyisoflavone reductase
VLGVAARLAGRVAMYQLVSTISVYAGFPEAGPDETSPLATLADPNVEIVTSETYGGLKVLCEQAAASAFGERLLVSRPGLLVGPHDPTGRFTWWVDRIARGGTVLAPAPADAPVQFIDARDAAAWHLHQAERGTRGTFNLTGPVRLRETPLTMGEFLDIARQTLSPQAQFVWADEAFLDTQQVAPWSDLPVWVPRSEAGLHRTDITRAVQQGLQCRPLAQTLLDTLAWSQRQPPVAVVEGAPPRPGLTPEREAAVLAAWAARETISR